MKKIFSFVSLMVCVFIMLSCSSEDVQLQTRSNNDNPYAAYYESTSSKPELSLLDVCLGYKTVDDLQNYNLVFTEKDVERLYEMSPEELVELKNSILEAQGITEEEVEKIVDESYEEFCADMNEEDMRKLNAFGEQYLWLPAGYASFSMVYPYEMSGKLSQIDQKYLAYARAIDNLARPLLNKFAYSTRSQRECEKYFSARMLIVSVAFCVSWCLPGPGWANGIIIATAAGDAVSAGMDYITCLRTRSVDE